MKQINRLLPIVLVAFLAFGCAKSVIEKVDDNQSPIPIEEWVVSEDFNWSNLNYVSLSTVIEGEIPNEFLVLKNQNNKTLAAVPYSLRDMDLVLPQNQKYYLYSASPSDHNEMGQRSYSEFQKKAGKSRKSGFCEEDANTFDRVISDSQTDLTVDGERVLITGSVTGTITVLDNAELYICSDLNLEDLIVKGAGQSDVYIDANATVTVQQEMSIHYPGDHIINLGVLNTGGINVGDGLWENFGEINTTSETYLNVNGKVINDGNWNTTFLKISGSFINNGKTNAANSTIVWGAGTFENNCMSFSEQFFAVQGKVTINGYVSVGMAFQVKEGGKVTATSGYHIYTDQFEWKNTGEFATTGVNQVLVEVKRITKIYNGAIKSGYLDICDPNGFEIDEPNFAAATLSCQSNINQNTCNPRGFVYVPIDEDGDGNNDESDPDDGDPNLSSISAYPAEGKAYHCFEDLWPYLGDYDFNDYVFSVKADYLSDGTAIKQIKLEIVVEAVGGSLPFNLAFRPLQVTGSGNAKQYSPISNWYSSSNNGSYNSTGDYVVLATDVPRWVNPYYTNTGVGPSRAPDTIRAVINVSNLAMEGRIVPELFLVSSTSAGHEIHLPNRSATNQASTQLFSTGQDNSDAGAGKWYTTNKGMPWGIEVIVPNSFSWPKSKVSVNESYPQFQNWATSAGEQNQYWYNSPQPTKVFSVQ